MDGCVILTVLGDGGSLGEVEAVRSGESRDLSSGELENGGEQTHEGDGRDGKGTGRWSAFRLSA